MQINPYLGFNGTCEAAFRHYAETLGGKITAMMTYADTPMADSTPEDQRARIVHARMEVGDMVLMGGDAPPQHYSKPQGISVSISIDAPDEAERIFHALAKDGQVSMPIQETFWAQRFGMCIDSFGTPWMINCEKPHGHAPAQNG